MQWSRLRAADAVLLLSLLSAPLPALSASLDCNDVRIDKESFNLSKLGGPHSVVTSRANELGHLNTTYTVDICKPLVKKNEACPKGTRVCAIQRQINTGNSGDAVTGTIPIAGDLSPTGDMEYTVERIGSDSNAEKEQGREGLRLVMKGGKREVADGKAVDQKAIIEFVCDKQRTGLEDEWEPEDKYDREQKRDGEGDKKEPPAPAKEEQLLKGENAALRFVSYGTEKGDANIETLRMTWYTKDACVEAANTPSPGPNRHWGFFTWLLIMAFLGIAAYLIFGSWLNYNRYGARGWDLLPHGDAIRDVPYLMKDWTRRVLNSVQGSGSRGGYSAV